MRAAHSLLAPFPRPYTIPIVLGTFSVVALLIDSAHRRWIAVTLALAVVAVGLHGLLGLDTPGGLTGGSTVGLWYGLVGSALMIFAGLLSAHRRLPVRRWLGS